MEDALAYLGHPILRKKAHAVLSIDQSIRDIIEHLKAIIVSNHGLGLAAPQIGVQAAILVACFPEPSKKETIVPGTPKVFINPKISDPSPETWFEEEGCLSIPKVYAPVARPKSITVTYQDEQGVAHTERLSGWPAKILMHENDHLNGALFIDRLETKDRRAIAADLERIKKRFKASNERLLINNFR
jgi:peptide deformylase